MEIPFPTKALLASFHSGLCVFIQIPPSGTKFETLASRVANIFSMKFTLCISDLLLYNNDPSIPISFLRFSMIISFS